MAAVVRVNKTMFLVIRPLQCLRPIQFRVAVLFFSVHSAPQAVWPQSRQPADPRSNVAESISLCCTPSTHCYFPLWRNQRPSIRIWFASSAQFWSEQKRGWAGGDENLLVTGVHLLLGRGRRGRRQINSARRLAEGWASDLKNESSWGGEVCTSALLVRLLFIFD